MQVDVKKLQAKYNAIKRKWLKIKDQPRKGSGLAPKSDPEWYEKIDYILGDTNADINELVSTSLVRHTAKKLFKMTTMIVTGTFTMIPKMIMNLIMQMKKIR